MILNIAALAVGIHTLTFEFHTIVIYGVRVYKLIRSYDILPK
jgi:hypothetical protein